MNFTTYHNDILPKFNQSFWSQENDISNRRTVYPRFYKSLSGLQITEICFLILILFEHTIVFLLTFKKQSSKRNQTERNQYTIILPSKSFLYSCLHRNWIRAFSFSNICFSIVYFLILILKHYYPNLVHHSSITFYSLPINLLQQILINFNTFHLFIISISVFQYFLRHYRLLKNTYSSYFFNRQSLLLTKHTNVALILSGSLALIFAYNFIFYAPKHRQTISLLPLVTFNMLLLPLINLIIFSFVIICCIIICFQKSNLEHISFENEQENLRFIIEKNTCIKCYSKILQNNPNLFQDKNYSYRNLYRNFFSTHLRSSYPFQIKRDYLLNNKKSHSQTDISYEERNDSTNNLLFKTTLTQLNQKHSSCHLCYYLLLIFLLKYILLTFPEYILQMLFHLKQFYQYILQHNFSTSSTYSLYEDNEFLMKISHYLLLLSRFGDSFLLVRFTYLIKKYFPCWCHFNSNSFSQQQTSHQLLTIKTSESSNNEPTSVSDVSYSNEFKQQEPMQKSLWKTKHRRFRLRFQFVPLWSSNRPRLFKEDI